MTARHWARLLEASRRERAALIEAFRDPRATQIALLQGILAGNAGSGFGQEHGFTRIANVEEFRRCVPIRAYEDFEPHVERIVAGERTALTSDPPIAFEQTGGSSGGRRLIPYTSKTLASFRRGVLAWLADLAEAYPGIDRGRAYFATSPATRNERQMLSGLPVGLGSDAAYFGEELAGDLASVLVGAKELSGLTDLDAWLRETLVQLATAEDLTMISVWSPTFLTTLIEALEADPEPVLRGLPADRGRLLEKCLASERLDVPRFWPKLRVVSAWADAGSAGFARQLRERLGSVVLQPKGLLATEGIFTLPLSVAPYPLPALNSTFLEFEAADGEVRLVDELEEGATYELIVTTLGGLYRYRIGDRVECRGHYDFNGGRVPMLSFVGRAKGLLDLVGEKLDEGFVATCLAGLEGFAVLVPGAIAFGIKDLFSVSASPRHLSPISCGKRIGAQLGSNPLPPERGERWRAKRDGEGEPSAPRYTLITETNNPTAAERMDHLLSRNPLYADARRIGQLGPIELRVVPDAFNTYLQWRLAHGHRLGDVKVPVTMPSWQAAVDAWPGLAQPSNHANVNIVQEENRKA